MTGINTSLDMMLSNEHFILIASCHAKLPFLNKMSNLKPFMLHQKMLTAEMNEYLSKLCSPFNYGSGHNQWILRIWLVFHINSLSLFICELEMFHMKRRVNEYFLNVCTHCQYGLIQNVMI